MLWAIVPLKSPEHAKTRLSDTLSAAERQRLLFELGRRVIDALRAAHGIDAIAVVSASAQVAAFARGLGARAIVQSEETGTAQAFAFAIRELNLSPSDRVLMIAGDLPLVTASAIERLIAASRAGAASVIAPDRHRRGTNALLCSPPHVIPPCFGVDSFHRHLAAAQAANMDAQVLDVEELAFDLDCAADFDDLRQRGPASLRVHAADTTPHVWLDRRPSAEGAYSLLDDSADSLAPIAAALREQGFGARVSYSRKVFVPLTQLCRDVCHYCTFAHTPRNVDKPYLEPDDVLRIARAGAAFGCKEVLFTLGDRPERRYAIARAALERLGFATTLDYLEHVARLALTETGLLPHVNPGLMNAEQLARLRHVAPSMGIMLESVSERLCEPGGPHYGSPDKLPARRLETLRLAGEARVPMTSGILIGIGETRRERIDSLLALRDLSDRYGHIQEIIVQNFRAKPGTKMRNAPEPSMEELRWTVAVARLIFGPQMSIQAPPNLYGGELSELIAAGINDWGGVSPLTPDHVNPEAPWPQLDTLAAATERAGCDLVERLTIYPRYVQAPDEWLAPDLQARVLRLSDGGGWARVGAWSPGSAVAANADDRRDVPRVALRARSALRASMERAAAGQELSECEIAELFTARGADFARLCRSADELRERAVGDSVSYAVVRNLNYTNICLYKCGFCAFSKGKAHADLRGAPYLVDFDEIARRVREAWDRGGTEVCMQGGIHPSFTGQTYLDICRVAKRAQPQMHIHAFSPLEVHHGARTLGISVGEFLGELKRAGLGSLPGTAAEILDDDVRRQLAPDKLSTREWLDVVAHAHRAGLPTTATIMFGHIEGYEHWARHLFHLRRLQQDTGGFTEFVPLPFVHMEAPIYLRGRARKGPTLREAILMHAVSRLVLYPWFANVQASWVKLGQEWAQQCLVSGANDLGGTLMNESISRAAGAEHGQELQPHAMQALIAALGRPWRQRTTLYHDVDAALIEKAQRAAPLAPIVNAPIKPSSVRRRTVAG